MRIGDIEIQPKQLRDVPVHQSSVRLAMACERKWFFKEVAGVKLRGAKRGDSACIGDVYHMFHKMGPGSEEQVKNWVEEKKAALGRRIADGEDVDGELGYEIRHWDTAYNKARVMAQIFWERFPDNPRLKVVGKEVSVKMWTRRSGGLWLEGTLDRILENVGPKFNIEGRQTPREFWVRDYKSSGDSLDFVFDGVQWDIQALEYRVLAIHYLERAGYGKHGKDFVVRGFILDGIQFPGIKQCSKDEKAAKASGRTPEEEYLDRVKAWYADKHSEHIRSMGVLFGKYGEDIYPMELTNAWSTMKRLINKIPEGPKAFVRDVTRSQCKAFHRTCEYKDLCESSMALWPDLFQNKYRLEEEK